MNGCVCVCMHGAAAAAGVGVSPVDGTGGGRPAFLQAHAHTGRSGRAACGQDGEGVAPAPRHPPACARVTRMHGMSCGRVAATYLHSCRLAPGAGITAQPQCQHCSGWSVSLIVSAVHARTCTLMPPATPRHLKAKPQHAHQTQHAPKPDALQPDNVLMGGAWLWLCPTLQPEDADNATDAVMSELLGQNWRVGAPGAYVYW